MKRITNSAAILVRDSDHDIPEKAQRAGTVDLGGFHQLVRDGQENCRNNNVAVAEAMIGKVKFGVAVDRSSVTT